MHGAGDEAVVKARSLFGAAILGAVVAAGRDLVGGIKAIAA
jgi:hypothetical protein